MFFVQERDRNHIARINGELHRKAFTSFPIFFPDSLPKDYDALYVESFSEHWQEYKSYNITAYYKFRPPSQLWTKYGIQESRDVAIYFSRDVLDRGYYDETTEQMVPFPYPIEGCAAWVDGTLYRITDTKDIDLFGNIIQSWITRIAFGVIIRPSSVNNKRTELEIKGQPPPITNLYGE